MNLGDFQTNWLKILYQILITGEKDEALKLMVSLLFENLIVEFFHGKKGQKLFKKVEEILKIFVICRIFFTEFLLVQQIFFYPLHWTDKVKFYTVYTVHQFLETITLNITYTIKYERDFIIPWNNHASNQCLKLYFSCKE